MRESFTIDPSTQVYKSIAPFCDPGHPSKCLIGTWGSMVLATRLTFNLDHYMPWHSTLGITEGEWRYTRPARKHEIDFARKFDLSKRLRAPLTVNIDTEDGTWTRKPKAVGGGRKTEANHNGNGKPATKSKRARQLAVIKRRASELVSE